jgi:hypothetical protein
MWTILKSEMRKPALVAVAYAAIMIVASPVSAATVDEGRQALTDFRTAVMADCAPTTGKFKGGCIGKIRNARQEARQTYNDCLADGGSRDFCRSMVNEYWVEKAATVQ